jgi:uncharacterized membrane protein YqjE
MLIQKNHRVIIYYLLLQVLFGGLLMYRAFADNSASDAILVAIPLYLGLALVFTSFAILRYKLSVNQELHRAYRNCIIATILLWLLAWPTFLYTYELVSHVKSSWTTDKKISKEFEKKKERIKVELDRLGLPNCLWNPYCETQVENGERFFIDLDRNELRVSSYIQPLPRKDTLAWLQLMVKNTNYFLPPNKQIKLDSLPRGKGKFFYHYTQRTDELSLGIESDRIFGSYFNDTQGNFHISIPLSLTLR